MKVVVATVQRGRREHLDRQVAAVRRSRLRPAAHVVVSMDEEPPRVDGCDVVTLAAPSREPLPVGAARNRAIEHAERAHAADLVIMLDVDCLPSEALVGRYLEGARRRPRTVLAGPVRYLPPGVPARGPLPSAHELASTPPHPARPVPADGELLAERRLELFWSLSFAIRPTDHRELGGFDEGYTGYGAEDTDYAQRAGGAGLGLCWVGGAEAYHQHHPVSDPPVEHLLDIVRNARRYRTLWGVWPMTGWLTTFRERGLVRWTDDELTILPGRDDGR